jgi:hypothetical protein
MEPEKKPLNDSIKLAIRDEVEKRFDAPTAAFIKLVEEEVEKRVKRQEKFYGRFIFLCLVLTGAFGYALWKDEIPNAVQKALVSEGALAAQQQITNILSDVQLKNSKLNQQFDIAKLQADDFSTNLNGLLASSKLTADTIESNLNDLPNSVNTNLFVPIRSRLMQLKRQDNVLLMNDIANLFMPKPFQT